MTGLKRTLSVDVSQAHKKQKLMLQVKAGKGKLRKTKSKLELKEFNQATSAFSSIAQNGTVVFLNNIVQGTDIFNRIGRHVNLVGVDIIIALQTPSVAFANDYVYMALVYDRQSDGFGGNFNDVFDISNSTSPALAFRNTASYRDRFEVLWEERCYMASSAVSSAPSGIGGVTENMYFRKHANLAGRLCEYTSSGTGIPQTGGVYLCIGSLNNSATATNNAKYWYNSKLVFTDP